MGRWHPGALVSARDDAEERRQPNLGIKELAGIFAALSAAIALIGGGFAVFNGQPWMPRQQVEREIAQLEGAIRRCEEANRAQDARADRERSDHDRDRARLQELELRAGYLENYVGATRSGSLRPGK